MKHLMKYSNTAQPKMGVPIIRTLTLPTVSDFRVKPEECRDSVIRASTKGGKGEVSEGRGREGIERGGSANPVRVSRQVMELGDPYGNQL